MPDALPPPDRPQLAEATAALQAAARLVVFTGAGISAESGVPTFRGPGGLWRSYRPEALATPQAFARDPRLVWEWYLWRRALVARCAPNAAHRAIARHAASPAHARRVTIVTQNVDGLHQRAEREEDEEHEQHEEHEQREERAEPPVRASRVLALHGSLFDTRCARCPYVAPHDLTIDATAPDTLPRCPRCAALLRPAVVWFGETLDPAILDAAFAAAEEADACLVVGTSALVHPAAGVAMAAARAGAALVEVNAEETPLSPLARWSFRGRAGDLVPALLGGRG